MWMQHFGGHPEPWGFLEALDWRFTFQMEAVDGVAQLCRVANAHVVSLPSSDHQECQLHATDPSQGQACLPVPRTKVWLANGFGSRFLTPLTKKKTYQGV